MTLSSIHHILDTYLRQDSHLRTAVSVQDIARYETVMLSSMQQPSTCLHFLRPGRLVRIREGHLDWGWGIVVSVLRKAVAVNAAVVEPHDMGPASAYVLDLLLSCDAASVKGQPSVTAEC